jgi:uncharacterized phage-associated protein
MPYSAIKVANEILQLARMADPPQSVTPLKLLKLVYIAHGWSLHFFERPLVNEPAQAWQYGPVVPSLYHAVKAYRASPIPCDIEGDSDPQELNRDDAQLIQAVFKSYGHLSGTQLSNMTHTPETPWSRAWNVHGRNAVIPDESIAQHYAALAQRRQQGNDTDQPD